VAPVASLFGTSRQETLHESLRDPFPPPRRWSVRVWWDESAASLLATLALALICLFLAYLWQRVVPPPAKVGEESISVMPITLGSGTELGAPDGGGGGGGGAVGAAVPVQGSETTADNETARDLGTVEQQDLRANAKLAAADPGAAYQASPERLARMRAIIDELERSGQKIQELGRGSLAGIFKIDPHVKSVVFVMDRSASMGWRQALERVKAELAYGLQEMNPDQSFGVIFFDHAEETLEPNFRLLPATKDNVERTKQWMESVHPRGGTMPADAMKMAIDAGPQLVVLLSDGEFDPFSVSMITQHNQNRRDKKCRIDCVGLSDAIVTLSDIAKQNGGSYRMAR
jgi:Mg-chelatase subunit ChlD